MSAGLPEPTTDNLVFAPPFGTATMDGILAELGVGDAVYRAVFGPLAYAVEVGHYPRLVQLLRLSDAQSDGKRSDEAVAARRRLAEVADLATAFERRNGPGSARNHRHRFWRDIWEKNERFRADGYQLLIDRPRRTAS